MSEVEQRNERVEGLVGELAELAELARAEVSPSSRLRVAALVRRDAPGVVDAYLEVGALARRIECQGEGETPDPPRLIRTATRPYHDVCTLRTGETLKSAGVEAGSLDLVILGPGALEWALPCLLALAYGGVLIAPENPTLAAVADARVQARVVERGGERVHVLRVLAPRELPPLLAPWSTLDRCACVDRRRVAAVIDAPLRPEPTRSDRGPLRWSEIARRLGRRVAAGTEDPQLGAGVLGDVAAAPQLRGSAGRVGVDLLLIVPHPDDETVYLGGVVAAAMGAGLSLHIATLTAGEGGLDVRDGGGGGGLSDTRRREQVEALEALGASACGRSGLGLVDSGKYIDRRRATPMTAAQALGTWGVDVVARIAQLIAKLRPRAVVTMDPTRDPNYSLHAHHLACGAAALVAAGVAAHAEGDERWPVAGVWTVIPSHLAEEAEDMVQVPVAIERKLGALAAYRSQGYSTQRLIAALEGSRSQTQTQTHAENVGIEVLIRRVSFAAGEDPVRQLGG